MKNKHTPSTRIKYLYKTRRDYASLTKSDDIDISLKDFAVDLASNGAADEQALANEWLNNKAKNK